MEASELGLTAARGVQVAASLSAFGVAVFWSVVAPPVLQAAEGATRTRIEAGSQRLFRASLAVAVAAGLVWLVAQAAFMAEAETMTDAMAAVWPVLTDTHFGHVLGARLLLLVLSALALGDGSKGGRRGLAAVVAGLALIMHTRSTHAAAAAGIDRTMLLGAESLHLLAAGAWLGSLAPLFIVVGALAPDQGARAARRFSPLGMLCVAILAGTALAQSWLLIGGLPALIAPTMAGSPWSSSPSCSFCWRSPPPTGSAIRRPCIVLWARTPRGGCGGASSWRRRSASRPCSPRHCLPICRRRHQQPAWPFA